ncbi:glycosyltransferase [Brucella sp. 458]|uniref:glycosyltransferase n=1 Tax=Brucella sp. 458 TaxID=2821140 RepID=UPI001ADF5227|nr:glycosyltransferase [Brucella sp. 458]QTN98421.1 glycosyltransferase [Brucella sp. 458]
MSEIVSITSQKPLLTISIVTFNPDLNEFRKTLDSLFTALRRSGTCNFSITIVDNSAQDIISPFIKSNYTHLPLRILHGHGNIGFGRAHNLAIQRIGEFHLILNPDIELHSEALLNAIAFMRSNPCCGLITPHSQWPNGDRQYLCKRYPAAFDLLLRGFAPQIIKSIFKKRLSRYEMQAETQNTVYWNPLIVSGCFMFFRSSTLRKTKGFDDHYFLYFEDFDLSIRVHEFADIAYVPTIKVIHAGGHAAKKGMWHIKIFICSSIHFYKYYGLKII